jgi:hypothetical protein
LSTKNSRGLQDHVIRLSSGILDCGEDVLTLQERVVLEDLLEGRTGAQQLQDVGDADALSTDAGSSTALARLDGDASKAIEVHATSLAYGADGNKARRRFGDSAIAAILRTMSDPTEA